MPEKWNGLKYPGIRKISAPRPSLPLIAAASMEKNIIVGVKLTPSSGELVLFHHCSVEIRDRPRSTHIKLEYHEVYLDMVTDRFALEIHPVELTAIGLAALLPDDDERLLLAAGLFVVFPQVQE